MCSEAVRTQSRVLVLGKSLSDFMRFLGVYSSSGEKHTRLRNQMKRLFGCSVTLIFEDAQMDVTASSFIAERTAFWWNERKPNESSLWDSKIELGEKFFNEIINHPVPIDMNTLTALKRSALGLDLYLWLGSTAPSRFALPNGSPGGSWYSQFGAHPTQAGNKNTVNNFRTKALRELKKIKLAWPGLNYSTAKGVLILHPSTPAIAPVEQAQLTS